VRGISDTPDPYKLLGVARDLGRKASEYFEGEDRRLSRSAQNPSLCDLKSVRLSAVTLRFEASNRRE
jgi:hypothetical protein